MSAIISGVSAFLRIFRYYSASDYYAAGEMGGKTNYWKLANTVEWWSGAVLFGAAAVTSILSRFGIAVEVNIMVWTIGVFMGYPVIGAVLGLLRWLAYDQEYSNKGDAAKYSAAVMSAAKTESIYATIF